MLVLRSTEKTFYSMLKPVVMSYVQYYRDDFLKHDREFFRKHPTGSFLLGIRDTGTDIVNLSNWDELDNAKRVYRQDGHQSMTEKDYNRYVAKCWVTRNHNKRFFVGTYHQGLRHIREISRDEANGILDAL